MNDIKVFAKNENELETLIKTNKIYGLKEWNHAFECAILIMKRGKRQKGEGIERANQEVFRTFVEKERQKHMEILETDAKKHEERKGK